MAKITLKSLQNYAKRNELHVVDSAEVDLSSSQSDNVRLPGPEASLPVVNEEDQKADVEERDEDWEDLEPLAEPTQT